MSQAESRVVARRGPVPKLDQWYREGKDVHLHVTQLIARVIQERRVAMPVGSPFTARPWQEFIDKKSAGEAREQSKRIVHGYNYSVGKKKMSLILNVPEAIADTLMKIYDKLFPEIRLGYQAWIERELRRSRTLWMPEPVRFRKVMWDQLNPDTLRAAYATYPQSIVGSIMNQTIVKCCNVFREDENEEFKEQWCAWYGHENYALWRNMRSRGDRSPLAILWSGMDVRLNVHDAAGISTPNDPNTIHWAATMFRKFGEVPIFITKEDPLTIPIDFKIGPSWGDQKDYILN